MRDNLQIIVFDFFTFTLFFYQKKLNMKTKTLFLIISMQIATFANGAFSQTNTSDKAENPDCWRWEKMMPKDLKKALATVPVAYLVISPLEWHGEAMSFGTDPAIGTEVAELAWRKTGGVLIPTLYLGSETEYKDIVSGEIVSYWGMEWATKEINHGSIYVGNYIVDLVLQDMLKQIEREGFKACVLVSGHGGWEYVKVLSEYEKRYTDRPMKVFYRNLIEMKRPENLSFKGSGGHADFAEASNLGAVDSTQVDKSLFGKTAQDQKIGLSDKNVDKIDYEKGRAGINYRAERIALTINKFLK
jgi:creatinine amidohydrolase